MIAITAHALGAQAPTTASGNGSASAFASSQTAARPRGGPLDRLFFTPAERRSIEAGKLPEPEPPAAAAGGAAGAMANALRVDGVLHRPDGSTVVWIDGAPAEDGRTPSGATVKAAGERGTVQVARPGEAARTLRAGQTDGAPELGTDTRVEIAR
jgi:hypothetical protein